MKINKSNDIGTTIFAMIAMVILLVYLPLNIPFINNTQNKVQEIKIIKTNSSSENTLEKIEELIMSLPDSPLKGNLLIPLGAHYGNSDEELNEILQDFAKEKIKELTPKPTI